MTKTLFLSTALFCLLSAPASAQTDTGAGGAQEDADVQLYAEEAPPASGDAAPAVSTDTASLPGLQNDSPPPLAPAPPGTGPGEGPWEVDSVLVKGNINVKPKVIIKTGHAKKGRLYYKEFINSDI
ncbi:MAG TPA: hypothetical protein PL037_05745, partial [Elusimicrobiales bacterium]|nr:hypothetical protein [Elusimicrobiales bacterium]